MTPNRPRGRQKNVTGSGKPIGRRGSGLGTGPVGGAGRGAGIGGSFSPTGGSHRPTRSSGSGGFGKLIILILVLLFGGGSGLTAMLGGDGGNVQDYYDPGYSNVGTNTQTPTIDLQALLGGLNTGSTSSGWESGSNTGDLDIDVSADAREKYTQIKGNGKDEMTILLYLCGTDLESRSKMATSDLQEMLDATVGDYEGDFRVGEHNSIPMIRLMLASLSQLEIYKPDAKIYLTHIAPSLHKPHDQTVRALAPEGLLVAYDGLEVEI